MKTLWMPIYWPNYLADTKHFSTVEHGAYLLLIAHYWCNGSLPTDNARLARIAGLSARKWRSIRSQIESKFDPNWKHNRIEFELAKALKLKEQADEKHRRWTEKRRTQHGRASPYIYKNKNQESKSAGRQGTPAQGFKALPGSPEFEKWKAWAFDKQPPLWRELIQRTQEGRAFDFATQWPPN